LSAELDAHLDELTTRVIREAIDDDVSEASDEAPKSLGNAEKPREVERVVRRAVSALLRQLRWIEASGGRGGCLIVAETELEWRGSRGALCGDPHRARSYVDKG
jgi:hypothetical protein